MLTILNTSILTSYGTYSYFPCTVEDARALVADGFESAVGHQATSDILTTLLGVTVPVNRQQFSQQPGQVALVFKLRGRPAEGAVLTVEQLNEIGFDFGVLVRRS